MYYLVLDEGSISSLIGNKASEIYRPAFHKTMLKLTFNNPSSKIIVYQGVTNKTFDDLTAWNYKVFLGNRKEF
jgi:hypothetical protein